jgi:hypothetical protein
MNSLDYQTPGALLRDCTVKEGTNRTNGPAPDEH